MNLLHGSRRRPREFCACCAGVRRYLAYPAVDRRSLVQQPREKPYPDSAWSAHAERTIPHELRVSPSRSKEEHDGEADHRKIEVQPAGDDCCPLTNAHAEPVLHGTLSCSRRCRLTACGSQASLLLSPSRWGGQPAAACRRSPSPDGVSGRCHALERPQCRWYISLTVQACLRRPCRPTLSVYLQGTGSG